MKLHTIIMVKKKKLNFNINNFSKFKSKIDYIILDKQPDNLKIIHKGDKGKKREHKILDNALIRENFQRNFVHNKLMEFEDNDLILINDLDEIPDLEKFQYKKKITIFQQKMLYFKFNLMYPDILWSGSKICKKKHLVNPQDIGVMSLHPSNITHKHGARPVTEGTRYVVVSFIKSKDHK